MKLRLPLAAIVVALSLQSSPGVLVYSVLAVAVLCDDPAKFNAAINY